MSNANEWRRASELMNATMKLVFIFVASMAAMFILGVFVGANL